MRRRHWGCAGLVLALACARTEPTSEPANLPAGGAVGEGLIASLETRYADGTVGFVLHVTNATDAAMELEFPSAQRFDFTVLDGSGESVWSWSADRSFAQVLGTETLAAGATVTYEAEWTPTVAPGEYTAVAVQTSTNKPIEMRTEFEIPGR